METFALLIGVETYDRPGLDVVGPCSDVARIARCLLRKGIAGAHITVFAKGTRLRVEGKDEFEKEFAELKSGGVRLMGSATNDAVDTYWRSQLMKDRPAESQLLVYWSGHGLTHTNGHRVFLCSDYAENLPNRVFDADAFLREVHREPFVKQLHLFDVCGNYPGLSVQTGTEQQLDRQLVDQVVFYATVEGAYAQTSASGGAFTAIAVKEMETASDPWAEDFPDTLLGALRAAKQRPFKVRCKYKDGEETVEATPRKRKIAIMLASIIALIAAGLIYLLLPKELPLPLPWVSKFDNPADWEGPAPLSGVPMVLGSGNAEYLKNPALDSLSEFKTTFEVKLPDSSTSVGWRVRANQHSRSSYQFRFIPKPKDKVFILKGDIVKDGKYLGPLNDTNGNEKVPYPWYPGEWIIVALKVDGCNFDHTFILRPPSDEQVAHMDKETQEVLLANGGVVGYPEPISLNAGRCSVTSGQFGFLSLDSTLKVLLFSLESIR